MEEYQRDLTETLPHEIVQLILSFLSVKEANKTCVLSTAWSRLWKPLVVNLKADEDSSDHDGINGTMKQVIAAFLDNHGAPRKLKISVGHQIVVAATKGYDNQELHLDFHKRYDERVITICTANNDSVLFKPERRPTNHIFLAEIPPMNSFLSLRTLHVRSFTSGIAENSVSALLSSCCFLESLKFEKCGGLHRIQIVVSVTSSLRMLEFSDCPNVDSMVISAPNLKTLNYAGVLPTTIQLQGTPHLVEVKYEVGYGVAQNQFDCEQLILFLASLKETEFLSISGWIIEWMCSAGVVFGHLNFKMSKLKKFCCTHSAMDARKRDSLACFLNIAPLLETLFINIDQKCTSIPPPFFHQYWHEPHLWKDYTTVKSESSHLAHLKVIKITGSPNSNSKLLDHEELLLMDLLLHKALNLNAMIITSSEDNDSWHVSRMPSSQIPNCQKNNPKRKVASGMKEEHDSFFVLTKMYDNGNVLF